VILEIPAPSFALDIGSLLGTEWALWRTGAVVDTLQLREIAHSLAIEARGTPCEGTWPLVECTWNGERLGRFRIRSPDWEWYQVDRAFGPGTGVLRIALLNDRFSPQGDLNLYIRMAVITGEHR
jgi:hypothetical protein